MTYTAGAALCVLAALTLDLVVLRTRMLRRRAFWTAYAIVLFFQLIMNGVLTGLPVVRYSAEAIIGWRIAFAPVEDLMVGFALVTATLSLWVWTPRAARSTPNATPGPRRPPDGAGSPVRGQ